MTLENIINSVKEQAGKAGRKAALYAMIGAGVIGITGCEKMINPLGPSIDGTVQQSSGYKFSNDAIEASITPTEKPFQKVLGHYQRPNESWTDYQEITDNDTDGEYDLSLSSTPFPGDYNFQFKTVSGDRETESAVATIPVYMNEEQYDAALERVVKKMGIVDMAHNQSYYDSGKDPTLIANNEMMAYYGPNANTMGYIMDIVIGIKKSNPIRGPPEYEGYYCIDGKSSDSETFDQTKKETINATRNGYSLFPPAQNDNDVEQEFTQVKAAGWPQIVP